MRDQEIIGLWEAYASVYEKYDNKKKKKVMHHCATHGEHVKWGVGAMIKEMHTLDEEGNITHYDIEFEHGIERNVPVQELTILEGGMHEHYINDEKNAEFIEDQKESVDLFDYLLEYLVAEGYADTNKAALAIMANMSEEWKQSIVETGAVTPVTAVDQKLKTPAFQKAMLGKPGFVPVEGVKLPKPGH